MCHSHHSGELLSWASSEHFLDGAVFRTGLQSCLGSCSAFFPVTEIKHSGQKQLREERTYLAPTCRSQSIMEGSQGSNLRQEPEGWFAILSSITSNQGTHSYQQERWMNAVSWLAHACSHLAGFLTRPRTTCLGNGATHSGPGPPTLINHHDNLPQICAQASWILSDSSIETSFSGDSRLYQVGS